jgi:ketosteroid isomerase-like protein
MKVIQYFFLNLFICVCLLSACAPTAAKTIAPRKPLSAEKINQVAKSFKDLTDANREAHLAKDLSAIEALFTKDVSFDDYSFNDHLVGTDEFMNMTRNFLNYFNQLKWKTTNYFISSEKIITIAEFWDMNWLGNQYNKEDPFIHVFLFEPQGNLISSWRLFYGYDFLVENDLLSETQANAMGSLLSAYAAAWSSKDSKTVTEIYTKDALRQDTLFNESQQGNKAIRDFAESFFTWYPDAQWTPTQMFGERFYQDKPQTIGSAYFLRTSNPIGETCEVMVVVLLQVFEGKIIQEEIFYQPGSLITCGWTQ